MEFVKESNVATLSRLVPAVSQLPVDWYFDEKIFELEKKLIFDAGQAMSVTN